MLGKALEPFSDQDIPKTFIEELNKQKKADDQKV